VLLLFFVWVGCVFGVLLCVDRLIIVRCTCYLGTAQFPTNRPVFTYDASHQALVRRLIKSLMKTAILPAGFRGNGVPAEALDG
jgi:hypothetical protein